MADGTCMNSAGLIHIYCGDGKGKTTSAVGLAVRSAGAGKRVLFVQFLKNGTSSEIDYLRKSGSVEVLYCRTIPGFFSRMTEEEKAIAKKDYSLLFDQAVGQAEAFDLLVFDEMIATCNLGIVSLDKILDFLDHKPQDLEVVLTGRNPDKALIERADYVSEIRKVKHPYDQGITARKGIEY